ncbi:MAG: histidine phosphatase family protein [Rhodoferax sp.]|nr:histidine phosphatase family protein [Rhodoferax sp.]
MDLVLWRHAQAQDWEPGCDDLARPLTSKGEKQAVRMAKWLDRQLPEGARIVCSPARRAEQTVAALGRKYKLDPDLSPDATAAQLLQRVQWPGASATVLVVGHQPTLGQVAAQLLGLPEAECSIGKGAVWWLRHKPGGPGAATVIVTVQTPQML